MNKGKKVIGGWEPGANEKNIYKLGFHSFAFVFPGSDAARCALGKPGIRLEMRNTRNQWPVQSQFQLSLGKQTW